MAEDLFFLTKSIYFHHFSSFIWQTIRFHSTLVKVPVSGQIQYEEVRISRAMKVKVPRQLKCGVRAGGGGGWHGHGQRVIYLLRILIIVPLTHFSNYTPAPANVINVDKFLRERS